MSQNLLYEKALITVVIFFVSKMVYKLAGLDWLQGRVFATIFLSLFIRLNQPFCAKMSLHPFNLAALPVLRISNKKPETSWTEKFANLQYNHKPPLAGPNIAE